MFQNFKTIQAKAGKVSANLKSKMSFGSRNSAEIKMTAAEEEFVPAPPPRCGAKVWKTPGREICISDVICDPGHL